MTERKTIDEIRHKMSELILEAAPEQDGVRRAALLVLADHWSDVLRKRRAETDIRVQ